MPKQTYHFGTRRDFLKSSSLLTGGVILGAPYFARSQNPNSKIAIACIGVGGKGGSDTDSAFKLGGDIVGLCDIDANSLNGKHKQLKDRATKENRTYDAKLFKDWRKMYEELGKSIDAVVISTPDHLHGVCGINALKMGKHIYCQKPLTQTVWEAREMRRLSAEKNLATQMGNQGSAGSGLRRAVEVVQAGIIGNPRELHVWSNRPIWPQGLARPAGEDNVPANLDWDLWLGPAPFRPYKKGVYHTFAWRGWQDFGTGALGDMACHTVNMPFRALKLGYPTEIEAESTGMNKETYPLSSKIRFQFPEREGLPPLTFWWYDGKPKEKETHRPHADLVEDIVAMQGELPGSGCLIIGDKGRIFSPDDYGSQFFLRLNDEKELKQSTKHEALKAIPETIPRSPGHYVEWIDAIKGGRAAYSNFDIAAYLTEIILLGCVALRTGTKLDWDGPKMRAKNTKEAAQYVKRKYRKGWKLG